MNPSTERSGAEFNSSPAERTILPEVDLNLLKNTEINVNLFASAERTSVTPELSAVSAQVQITDDTNQDFNSIKQLNLNPKPASSRANSKSLDSKLDDQGVIEQIWVDQAKKIIMSTSENPRLREEKIKKLRDDYLWEKYGFKFGETVK